MFKTCVVGIEIIKAKTSFWTLIFTYIFVSHWYILYLWIICISHLYIPQTWSSEWQSSAGCFTWPIFIWKVSRLVFFFNCISEQYFWKFFWTVFLDSILHQFWLILFLDHIFQPAASLDRYFPGKWSIFFWVSLIHIFIIDHHHRYYPRKFCLENWTKKNYLDNWTEKIYLENLTKKIVILKT